MAVAAEMVVITDCMARGKRFRTKKLILLVYGDTVL
jgi:hypothetical protein